VKTGSDTLAEVRERYTLGRCSSHDVAAASRDLTWANNLFRQRREDLGHALRRLEILLDERPGRDFVHGLRFPDLPEDGTSGKPAGEPRETALRSVERRADETLGRAVEVRREIEETLTGNRRRSLAYLRAHRDELEAQSRWVSARKQILDHRIDGLQAETAPTQETAGSPVTNPGTPSSLTSSSLPTVGGPGFPRGKSGSTR
jgi:outer membrane protein TolC